jgi:molybdate transport system permease protein
VFDRLRGERLAIGLVGSLLAIFLALPLLALLFSSADAGFVEGLAHPAVWPALRLSLLTTSVTLLLVVLLGTPLAWTLARSQSRVAHVVETVVQLPIVVPPAVAGVALLLTFGRRAALGSFFAQLGLALPFTTTAVVLAELFVSAPFFVQAAISAFRRVDENLLRVARSFGASPFRVFLRIALPLATPGLVAGAAMSWARSLGEFGATLMFAGNLEGRTQTLPLAIYVTLESDMHAAQSLSILLVTFALALLLLVRAMLRRQTGTREPS